jgi:multicomponent Na+:H+ antiporter subunit A
MIHRSLILDVLVDVVVRTAIVFSLYLLFAGHNAPGGGFIAGLVFGIALILKYVAGGRVELRKVLPVSPETLLGGGLFLAILTGMAGWAWGDAFLESNIVERDFPVLGTVKVTSALPFDIGVFVIVVGLAAALVLSLGREEEGQ